MEGNVLLQIFKSRRIVFNLIAIKLHSSNFRFHTSKFEMFYIHTFKMYIIIERESPSMTR